MEAVRALTMRYSDAVPAIARAASDSPVGAELARHAGALERWLHYNVYTVPWRGYELRRVIEGSFPGVDLEGKRVLDLGCGLGAMALYFALDAKARHIVGVDSGEEPLRAMGRALGELRINDVSLVASDVAASPMAGNAFDVIVSYDVLYHPHFDREAVLQRAIGHLVPGGVIAIKVVNRLFPVVAVLSMPGVRRVATRTLGRGGSRLGSFVQPAAPTSVSLRRELTAAGFESVRIHNRISGRARGFTRWVLPDVIATARKPEGGSGRS